MPKLSLELSIQRWPMRRPFQISGFLFEAIETLTIVLDDGIHRGWGEACGVYYRDDTPGTMQAQIERLRRVIERGVTRDELQALLPPGGARNALDCALWDLEARRTGRPVWELAGLDRPRPLLSTYTCGAAAPADMAQLALSYQEALAIKLKLTGDGLDADRIAAVREARPDAWIGVDANQGFTRDTLSALMPVMVHAGVALIEQPLRVGQEHLLEDFRSPIPLAADESAQDRTDLAKLVGRFQVVNIKLDKCGGLTEGLAMARAARQLGLEVMVGNMMGTSLSMAPAFLIGQFATVVDLDGPILLATDRDVGVRYSGGLIDAPDEVWGGGSTTAAAPIRP